jgi:hypothetical protein
MSQSAYLGFQLPAHKNYYQISALVRQRLLNSHGLDPWGGGGEGAGFRAQSGDWHDWRFQPHAVRPQIRSHLVSTCTPGPDGALLASLGPRD